jgi:hypothetical protein
MGGGFALRFVLEAGFLVLLAVVAGLADLDTWLIAAVMAGGWLLVTLIEWLAWRAEARATPQVAPLPQEPEPRPGWDIEEILAPLPEDEEQELEQPEVDEGQTSVLPPQEPSESAASRSRRARFLRRGPAA